MSAAPADPLTLLQDLLATFATCQPREAAEWVCELGWGTNMGKCASLPNDPEDATLWVIDLCDTFDELLNRLQKYEIATAVVARKMPNRAGFEVALWKELGHDRWPTSRAH